MTEVAEAGISLAELRLAARNHGLPLEALRYDVTPVGLHYLLTHYDIPLIDTDRWRLAVGGRVTQPLELTLEDLRALPARTRRVTMECAGNGRTFLEPRPVSQPWVLEAVGTGEWTGVALADVLAAAGLTPDAIEVVFTGADRGVEHEVEQWYARSLPVTTAAGGDALLAYELNGAPLPPQHGAPLRLVVPGWYGMTNVKWLTSITAVDTPFTGHQQLLSYRLRQHEDEAGEPLSRMRPRALMTPPGVPDFLTRECRLPAGEHELSGRAWSGFDAVTAVDVSTDAGASWNPVDVLQPMNEPAEWQAWTYRWSAAPGQHELCCRATDGAGNRQPVSPSWNLGGYANNAVQRVAVHVT